MKKVLNTKHYSVKQMENMAYNLREKFSVYCSIGTSTSVDAHTGSKDVKKRKKYSIYHEIKGHVYSKSWQELQLQYYKLMKEGE